MAKDKKEKAVKEKKERKSEWKDYMTAQGYKFTGDDKVDQLNYYRMTARNPCWTLKEVQAGERNKPKESKE